MLVLAKTSMCALLCNPAPPCKPQPCSMGTLVGLFSCHERACAACLFLHLKPMSHLVFASPCTVQAHAGAVPSYLVLRAAVAFCRRAAVWSPDIACACPNGAASPRRSLRLAERLARACITLAASQALGPARRRSVDVPWSPLPRRCSAFVLPPEPCLARSSACTQSTFTLACL